MHGKIDFFVEESFFEFFLMKTPLPPICAKGSGLQFVAGGFDDDDFGIHSRWLREFFADGILACHLASMLPRVPIRMVLFHCLAPPDPARKLADCLDLLNLAAKIFFALQAASRVEKHFFEEIVNQGFNLFSLLHSEAVDAFGAFTNKFRAVGFQLVAKRFHNAD